MTNDDVLGDEIPNDQQDAFRQFCFQMLRLGVGVSLSNGFLHVRVYFFYSQHRDVIRIFK